MKFLVAHIGARRAYAVPAILEKAGLLDRFYTDFCLGKGCGNLAWSARHIFPRFREIYDQGQPELALELATPADALANQALFLVRLDALAFLKNWAEVEKELSDSKAPLSQTLIFIYRARAAQELGDPAGSEANWDRARAAAATDPGMLSYMGQYAVKMGLYDEAKKTYMQMAHMPEQALAHISQIKMDVE